MLRPLLLAERPHWEVHLPQTVWPVYEDFRSFLCLVWEHLGLPHPTRAQLEIAHRLHYGVDTAEFADLLEDLSRTPDELADHLMYDEPREDIVRAFRSLGKSYVTCAFAVWRIMRNPRDEKVLILSATTAKAKEFVSQAKGLIESMDILRWLIDGPREKGARRRDHADMFDVAGASLSQSHSVTAKGIDGQITGSRATLIIPDDIEIPKNSLTETQRSAILRKIRSDLDPIRKTEHGMGDVIFLGTPQTEESVYNVLVKEMLYRCICIPAKYPSPEKERNYLIRCENTGREVNMLARYLRKDVEDGLLQPGDPTDDRFGAEELIKLESRGRAHFALQYMLDTSLSDAERYPLRQRDLIVMALNPTKAPMTVQWGQDSDKRNIIRDIPNLGFSGDYLMRPLFLDPEWRPYEGKVLYVDPAGRGKDETAWGVVGHLGGTLFCMRLAGFSGDPIQAMAMIAADAVRFQVNVVEVEPNYGQGMWVSAFAPILRQAYTTAGVAKAVETGRKDVAKNIAANPAAGCSVQESEWSKGQKELRIITGLEPVIAAHRLVIDEDLLRSEAKPDEAIYSLLYQLTHITHERGALRHDDRIEALWGGVMHFMRAMGIDAVEARGEAMLEEKLRIAEQFVDDSKNGFLLGRSRTRRLSPMRANGERDEVTIVRS